jgi:DNA polymerase (family X)
MHDVEEVARGLDEIARRLSFAGDATFKVKAFERGARVVEALGDELASVIDAAGLRNIEGIGRALEQQILELWSSGSASLLRSLRAAQPEGAAELSRVEGMTPKRILALDAALGIRSIGELRAACSEGRVRGVRGFGEATERRLLAACERAAVHEPKPATRLLLSDALELCSVLERSLDADGAPAAWLAGAVRRGEETVGEIDLAVAGEMQIACERLARLRQVVRLDPACGRGWLAEGVPLIVHGGEPGAAGNTLFLATGNDAHVRAVGALANARGFEIAGCPGGADLPARTFSTEQALYAAVGLSEVPPERRIGGDELDAARRGDFSDLIALPDICGLVHCHTTYSDGRNSVEEMARAAHALGMKYITITDHSPSAHYARGVTLDRLERQWEEIAAAEERVPIRILRGTESDILADGSLDFPDAVLERFDVIIASIHARHRLDRQQMTERLKRAMSLPVFKIWGHGLGRILKHRAPIDCDVPAVLDALAASRGAVELNADPYRLDLPAAWIPAARERGLGFVIAADAHSTQGFGVLRYGVLQARRGGVLRSEVLNARPADEFARLVRPT